MEMIKLTIDDKPVEVVKDMTILKAAKTVGIDIPTLCYFELRDMNIENRPAGCRICVVEVKGRRNLAPACSTKVENGMVVSTHNIRVLNARRTVLELILSDHPAECLTCAKNGNCELRAWHNSLASVSSLIQGHNPLIARTHHLRSSATLINASCAAGVK